jgi:AAA domain
MAGNIEIVVARADALIASKHSKEPNGNAETAEASHIIPPRTPLQWTTLQGLTPPEREWVVSRWIPCEHPTLLAGKGGIGKTLLAQHLATSVVLEREFIAHVERPRRVLFWAGEDDHNELWRRQLAICGHFEVPISALGDALVLQSYMGADITLAAPVFGSLAPTPMLAELREQVLDYKAELVILDNSARLFGGNENDRHAVTTFLAWVLGACAPAAVLLLSHPARAIGSEFSGSSAWEGSVRTRLYMSDQLPGDRAKKDDEDEGIVDPRRRYLSKRKANYSPLDVVVFDLDPDTKVLVPESHQPGRTMGVPNEDECRRVVRTAVERLAALGEYGNTASNTNNYLPKLATRYKLLDRLSERQFSTAMFAMISNGQLKKGVVGKQKSRNPRHGIVLP